MLSWTVLHVEIRPNYVISKEKETTNLGKSNENNYHSQSAVTNG